MCVEWFGFRQYIGYIVILSWYPQVSWYPKLVISSRANLNITLTLHHVLRVWNQAIMEGLTPLSPNKALLNPHSIRQTDIFFSQSNLSHNGTGIHCFTKLVLEEANNLFPCTEREEILHRVTSTTKIVIRWLQPVFLSSTALREIHLLLPHWQPIHSELWRTHITPEGQPQLHSSSKGRWRHHTQPCCVPHQAG